MHAATNAMCACMIIATCSIQHFLSGRQELLAAASDAVPVLFCGLPLLQATEPYPKCGDGHQLETCKAVVQPV